jgi:RNA polymerase sigma factor (sigma-70 family)
MTDQDTRPAADRDLLRAFAERRDGEAFAELVRRHGGLVHGVCERILGADADDAFQATFLVLARKAGSVRRPEVLGNWLYGVAVRCAKRAKARAARRQAREQPVIDWPAPEAGPDWRDVRPVLDEELARLPERLRAAVVLCELEGVPRPEAAARLGVPEGTLSSRLARGKEVLRRRLVKRGVTLSAVGVGLVLANAARAAVPPGLAEATAAVAIGGAGSVAAVTLANAEVSAMFWVKAVKVGLAAAVVAAVGGGAAAVAYRQVDENGRTAVGRLIDHVHGVHAHLHADKKPDKEKLQGEWKVVSIKLGGQDHPNKDQVGDTMTFKGDSMALTPYKAEFKLDPATDPKQVDFTLTESPDPNQKGQVSLGIYKLDGDKLILHAARPGAGERPTDFESKDGQVSMLFTLERVKK